MREALKLSKKHKVPVLVRADGAIAMIRPEQLVTLDLGKGIVFKGLFDPEEEFRRTCKL